MVKFQNDFKIIMPNKKECPEKAVITSMSQFKTFYNFKQKMTIDYIK